MPLKREKSFARSYLRSVCEIVTPLERLELIKKQHCRQEWMSNFRRGIRGSWYKVSGFLWQCIPVLVALAIIGLCFYSVCTHFAMIEAIKDPVLKSLEEIKGLLTLIIMFAWFGSFKD